jgi:6,7-dimethyl-8-ribityllumazine synthase
MPTKIVEGNLDAKGLKFAIIVSRFNSFVTDRLITGALDALSRTGASPDDLEIVKVPGTWELPLIAREVAAQKRHNAVICLGTVIQGETPHYEYIMAEAAKGLGQASLEFGIPITFGVLTCDTLEQAIDRAGAKSGNKGFDAAMSAIEMANLMRRLREKPQK